MKKQAILFDFWETLVHDSRERETFSDRLKMMQNYLVENGVTPLANPEEAFEAGRVWFLEIYHKEQRTPALEERLSWVLNYSNIELSPDLLEPLVFEFGEMGLRLDPVPSANVKQMLEVLSRDYQLGIVSDTGYTPGRVLRKHLEKHDLLQYFSAFSFSNETGTAKPNQKSFLAALNPLGVIPADAIHCGDLPGHDVKGAKLLGMTAVLYTGCHAVETNGVLPDYTISNWLELPEIVGKVFGQ